jgi:hypothetical protein
LKPIDSIYNQHFLNVFAITSPHWQRKSAAL